MHKTAITAGLALCLSLAACNNEPEETPDITEAIPVDQDGQGSDLGENGTGEDGAGEDGAGENGINMSANGSDSSQTGTPESPGPDAPDTPSTMQSGTVASDAPISLEGSKLQRADR